MGIINYVVSKWIREKWKRMDQIHYIFVNIYNQKNTQNMNIQTSQCYEINIIIIIR